MFYDHNTDHFDNDIFRQLLKAEADVCVSIYMPSIKAGKEQRQNSIRFGNLKDQADHKMLRYGVADDVREAVMEPLNRLWHDQRFWKHQSEGLAVFASAEELRVFRLPVSFEEGSIVDRRYYIRPLISLADEGRPYYVLAVSRGESRFLRCTSRDCIREDLPAHLQSFTAFQKQYDFEKQRQQHEGDAVGHATGRLHPVRHGQGVGDDSAENTYMKEYFSHLSHVIEKGMAPHEGKLLLAGESRETGLFQEALKNSPLQADILTRKNVSELTDAELREMASEQLTPVHDRKRRSALQEYEQLRSSEPGKVDSDLSGVLQAAYDRRVRVLFVPGDSNQVWGRYHPDERKLDIEREPDNELGEEITNLAASVTLKNGGEVYVMPHGAIEKAGDFKPLAAIYTW